MLFDRVKPLTRILAEGSDETHGLKRSLGPWALTAMGIGAIIGTGIFVLTGVASATRAGPALTLSFVVAGIVSALAALCYAEVSSKVPISGSAYTYTYATLGEFPAWIIGWSLVLEYALGASTVSVGWSGYFTYILQTLLGWNIPQAWQHSHWDATPGIANLPAAGIIFLITALLVRGTKESGTVNAIIVAVKVAVVLFFIAVGIGHIDTANYHLPPGPQTGQGGFFPFGIAGMFGGAAFIFFAYIGFDAVSTTAEEAKNPAKDLPFGIIMSLAICTVLYIIVVAILNGMVPFYKLNVSFPVAFAVNSVGLPWAGVIVSFGAIAGLTTVLLVMMYAQTRVFYAMSRDGLIPPSFTRLHPRWRTPMFSQIFFGVLIAAAGALFPIGILGSLTNMGTLVAFVLVSVAVPALRRLHPQLIGTFTVPFGPYLIPVLSALTALFLIYFLKEGNPLVWGFFPLVWLGFLVWLAVGLIFYFSWGRRHSMVSLSASPASASS
ncbi:MAG TPA: amino acid permease [Rhizomicrobium sp.]|jgi:APA family basic amino acid/polyamine antiporter|nr:amino acid permease [Rhizomicrobium sp.]